MSIRDFEQTLKLAGELVTPQNCPSVIPKSQLDEIFETLKVLGIAYDIILKNSGIEDIGVIVLLHSASFSCRVERIRNDRYIILVPLGMIARIRVLARLLLRFWQREDKFIRLITPPARENKTFPVLLRPIFSGDLDTNIFWDDINKLDKILKDAKPYEEDVREIVHLALVYLISHEFTHIWHRHFILTEKKHLKNTKLSLDDIRRGLELDADDGAARISMLIMNELVTQYQKKGLESNIILGWLRLSFVTAMIYGIFDAQHPHLLNYEKGVYNHPIVRREMFFNTMMNCVELPKEMKEKLQDAEYEGWRRCIHAFNGLTLEAITGKYGDYKENCYLSALELLLHDPKGRETSEQESVIREAAMLKHEVDKLIKPFLEMKS